MQVIYNSFSGKKEPFVPLVANQVGIYVCGLTVYDLAHLGHAKLYLVFDAIIGFLQYQGYEVNYVRNITDIDDKLIEKANKLGLSVAELAEQYTKKMQASFRKLGLQPPNTEPKATLHMPEIIQMIETLLAKGYAYTTQSGDVYFKVSSFADYGKLSGRDLSGQEHDRGALNLKKLATEDFALWKAAKPLEPSWQSPWGAGRPGWHIECSAMSCCYLGSHFDIHGGGQDLLFPHHENELAQASAANANKFVNTWMHVGFLQIANEKMSKSLANFITLEEVLAKFPGESLRLCLLMSHYRSQQNFSMQLLEQADQALMRLYVALNQRKITAVKTSSYEHEFIAAMHDDFNTSKAIAVLFDLSHVIEKASVENADYYASILHKLGRILGLFQYQQQEFFHFGFSHLTHKIEQLLQQRQTYREQKQWQQADDMRQQLLAMGVEVFDKSNTSFWRRSTAQKA